MRKLNLIKKTLHSTPTQDEQNAWGQRSSSLVTCTSSRQPAGLIRQDYLKRKEKCHGKKHVQRAGQSTWLSSFTISSPLCLYGKILTRFITPHHKPHKPGVDLSKYLMNKQKNGHDTKRERTYKAVYLICLQKKKKKKKVKLSDSRSRRSIFEAAHDFKADLSPLSAGPSLVFLFTLLQRWNINKAP